MMIFAIPEMMAPMAPPIAETIEPCSEHEMISLKQHTKKREVISHTIVRCAEEMKGDSQ